MPRGHLQGEPVQTLLLPVPLPVMRPRRSEALLAAEEARWQTFGAAERASLQLCAALLRNGAAARAVGAALHGELGATLDQNLQILGVENRKIRGYNEIR